MTNAEKIAAMSEAELRTLLSSVVVDCIQEGYGLQMSSSDILESVCSTLKENGFDVQEPVDSDEDEESDDEDSEN
jgi:hypothetical protein